MNKLKIRLKNPLSLLVIVLLVFNSFFSFQNISHKIDRAWAHGWVGKHKYLEKVSDGLNGYLANGSSDSPSTSSDGRYIVFESRASNLVDEDHNDFTDIFRKDMQTGEIIRISEGSQGEEANGNSRQPSISSGGRYVAFASEASNIVEGDTNGLIDIFRKDIQTGYVVRVSTNSNLDEPNHMSYNAKISAGGRYVVFGSYASNIVEGDTNGAVDIFRKDIQTGETVRGTTSSSGEEANSDNHRGSVSADGRFIVFESYASNLVPFDGTDSYDTFRKDLQTNEIVRVSENIYGERIDSVNNALTSASGKYVVFGSGAEIVSGDSNGQYDIYRKDMETNEFIRVSEGTNGEEANLGSWDPSISDDGRYVVFESSAGNLVSGDINEKDDVFKKDLETGELKIISISARNRKSDNHSWDASMSFDGRYVTFASNASNLTDVWSKPIDSVFHVDTMVMPEDIPPVSKMHVSSLASDNSMSELFALSWSGSDNIGGTGIDKFQISYRAHGVSKWSILNINNEAWTAKNNAFFDMGTPGGTYYFKVRAMDNAGNMGTWSVAAGVTIPMNENVLNYSSGWKKIISNKSFKKSIKSSTAQNATATYAFKGKSLKLITSTGKNYGKLDVYISNKINGKWGEYKKAKTIDLYSSNARHRVSYLIKMWKKSSARKVKFVVTGMKSKKSTGNNVVIDGLAILK